MISIGHGGSIHPNVFPVILTTKAYHPYIAADKKIRDTRAVCDIALSYRKVKRLSHSDK